ncbi:hypothetical protein RB595_002938 [Gaeumannomyces hyphopodioides]
MRNAPQSTRPAKLIGDLFWKASVTGLIVTDQPNLHCNLLLPVLISSSFSSLAMADDLFAIDLSGDESQNEAAGDKKSKRDKNRQTEEEFQQLRSEYRPRMENGETVKLPLGQAAVPKLEAQDLLHAAEELYFYKRYAEAADFVRDVLAGDPGGLDQDTKAMLALYRARCLQKEAGSSGGPGSAASGSPGSPAG